MTFGERNRELVARNRTFGAIGLEGEQPGSIFVS